MNKIICPWVSGEGFTPDAERRKIIGLSKTLKNVNDIRETSVQHKQSFLNKKSWNCQQKCTHTQNSNKSYTLVTFFLYSYK